MYAHFIKYTVEERNVALHTVRFDSQGGSWIQTKDNANKLTSPQTGYNLNTIYLFMIISFASIGVSGYSLLKKNN